MIPLGAEQGLELIVRLVKTPYYLSPGWLKIEPTFGPQPRKPRFQRLPAGDA